MSWQAYVDTSLVGTGNLDKAAIFSAADGSKWAGSSEFDVVQDEIKAILASYKDTGAPKKIQETGFHVAGEKYICIKAEDRSLYGMKGKTGVIIVKTTQCLLVSHHPDTVQTPNAATTVEQLGDYLVGLGY